MSQRTRGMPGARDVGEDMWVNDHRSVDWAELS